MRLMNTSSNNKVILHPDAESIHNPQGFRDERKWRKAAKVDGQLLEVGIKGIATEVADMGRKVLDYTRGNCIDQSKQQSNKQQQ